MTDNRHIRAIDFYAHQKVSCENCFSPDDLIQLGDRYHTILCEQCAEKTLEQLNFSEDFEIEGRRDNF